MSYSYGVVHGVAQCQDCEWHTRFRIDFGFTVKDADDLNDAFEKALELISEPTENISYRVIKATKFQMNPELKHKVWQTARVSFNFNNEFPIPTPKVKTE